MKKEKETLTTSVTRRQTHRKTRLLSARFLAVFILCSALLLTACGNKGGSGAEGPEDAASDSGKTESSSAEALTIDTDLSGFAGTLPESSSTVAYEDDEPETAFSAKDKNLTIVLDPGHCSQVPNWTEPIGPGAEELTEADTVGNFGKSSSTYEYDLTMNMCKKLRPILESRGYKVVLTHSDTALPISCAQRATVANENHADALISIHANVSEDTTVSGAMTACITEDNPYHPGLFKSSYRLSEVLLDTFCAQTGAKRERVWMTDTKTTNNWSEVPSTIIEIGYMSNPDEDLLMNMDSYRIEMANAIADGLDQWFAEMPEEELAMHPGMTPGAAGNEAAALSGTSAETAAPENAASAGTIPSYAVPGTNPDPPAAGQTDQTAAGVPGQGTQTDGTSQTGDPGDINSSAEIGTPSGNTTTQPGTQSGSQSGSQAPQRTNPYDINKQAEMGTSSGHTSSQNPSPSYPVSGAPGSDGSAREESEALYFSSDEEPPYEWGVPEGDPSDSVDFTTDPDDTNYPGAELNDDQ